MTCCVDVKMSQLLGIFLKQYQGMTPRQISGYKRKLNRFSKTVFEDGNIEEMLELFFSNEKHYNNILKFLGE
jgi:hypothetical protein